jgi:cytochrome c-type biogenesis protein CcmE
VSGYKKNGPRKNYNNGLRVNMIAARRRKLGLIVFILSVLSLVCALVLYALRQNISLFYTPTQISAGEVPIKRSIRVGGMVEKNSISRSAQGLQVQFKVTDYTNTVTVIYTGILPDLFREEQGIVAEGELSDNQTFQATRVLAKHDANYMPPEVKAALAGKRARSLEGKELRGAVRRMGDYTKAHESGSAYIEQQFASAAMEKKTKAQS